MSIFRTLVLPQKLPFAINYQSPLFFIGSCFSNHIAERLQTHFFKTYSNPFGVLYNPISIKNSLEILMRKKEFTANDLFFDKEQYHSFWHHSSFSSDTEKESLQKINIEIKKASLFLKQTDVLFITFGTAFVYEHIQSQQIVSNCHKISAKEFNRYRLDIDDILTAYFDLIPQLQAFNPQLKIVFTVSPVRHWKDGAHENQLSKSILHLAIDKLQKKYDSLYYFPSYELLIDDLRDYRFYADDMLHINNQAIDYVYQHFSDVFYNQETKQIEKRLIALNKAKQHRVFNKNTKQYQEFVSTNKKKVQQLQKEYPFLELDSLIKYWDTQL